MAGALCSRNCAVGYFCDPGTNACETCASICNPLRNTIDECLSTRQCKGHWPSFSTVSSTVPSLVSSTSSVVSSESSNVILYAVTIGGSILALVLIVALIYRLMKRNSASRCWKKPLKTQPPVQLSLREQRRTNGLPDGGNPYLLVGLITSNTMDAGDSTNQRMDAV